MRPLGEWPRKRRRRAALRGPVRAWAERLEGRVLLSDVLLPTPYVPPDREIAPVGGSLLSAPAAGKPLDVALAYLRSDAGAMGLTSADVADPLVTDQYTDSGGQTHIYLRQRVNGLPIANADISISLTADNRVIFVGGHFVPNAAAQVPANHASTIPSLSAGQALTLAAPSLELTLQQAPAVQTLHAATAAAPASVVLTQPEASTQPIPATAEYIPTSGGLHLGWNMVLRTPDGEHWYDADVDGANGALLGAVDWANPLTGGTSGNGTSSGGAPSLPSPGVPGEGMNAGSPTSHAISGAGTSAVNTQSVGASGETYDVYPLPLRSPNDGPRALVGDPADPAFSPFGWHDTNGAGTADSTLTSGNNVNAFADLADTGLSAFAPDGGPSLTFDYPQNLSQDPSSYLSAAVTQLFYITNELHDIHASYGFTEAAGNFQQINYGGQGAGNDSLQAEAQDGGGLNNSNMFVPPDGQSPIMQMYLWNKTSPLRDADFDNQIIIHEYGHGVSTRLTGGPADSNSLFILQSGGMGEGWSDWWALMFTQRAADAQNGAYGIGNYVLGQDPSTPGGPIDGGGIRKFPYSFDLTKDPLTFADFGTNTEVHASGTIWASALWDLNWLLIDKYGFSPVVSKGYDANIPGENGGNNLALKLVMDALKLQPSNPSFTDARDAIVAADLALNGGQDLLQIWTAFARRGLGFSTIDASSASGTITPAFDLPPSLQSPRVVSQSPAGTVTSTVSSVDFTFDQAMDPTSFSVADDVDSFIGPGGADLRSSISGFSWLNGDTTLHITFPAPSVNGRYTLTIGPNILSAGSDTPMDQNANGSAGEASDTYSARFGFTTNQLAVASITPANGAVAVLPATQIDVHFNQAVDPSSVGVYNLELNRGQVTNAALIDPTTVQYTLSGFNFEGPVNVTLAAGALRDLSGADSAAFSSSFSIDAGTTAFPTPFYADAAPLVSERTTSGVISPADDVDSFTLNLQAGQTLGAILMPLSSGLQGAIDLLDPLDQTIASASASAGGAAVLFAATPIRATSVYTLRMRGIGGSMGGYQLRAILDSAIQAQAFGGPTDNTPATAQNIDSSFVPLGNGASRAAVLGQLPTGGNIIASDTFSSFSLGSEWSTFSSDPIDGEIFLRPIGNSGKVAMLMDHNDLQGLSNNLDEAVWSVDLSGANRPILSFGQTSFGDEQDYLPANFVGHANGDGVSISDDNVHWHLVWNGLTNDMQGKFGTVAIDLAAAAAQAGMTPGKNFKIKFQQYDNFDIPTDGRGYESIQITENSTPKDYYSFTANAGDSISAQVAALDVNGGQRLDLLDSGGNLLASAIATPAADHGSANTDLTLNGFVAPSDGTYYLRISGNTGGQYIFSVAKDADLQVEPLESTPQVLHAAAVGGVRTALGTLNSQFPAAQYTIALNAGQSITLTTGTPGDDVNALNVLDPSLRLLSGSTLVASDDNSAPNGRNAMLSFTATSTGIYTIEVDANGSTAGDYLLTINGGSPSPAPFAALMTRPASESVVASATTIDVTFTQPVLMTSVDAGAISIDGVPATSVQSLDGKTLVFGFTSPLTDGQHSVTLAAGSIEDIYGDPIAVTTTSFTLQTTPPHVVASSISPGDSLPPGDLTYTVTFDHLMLAAAVDASAIRLVGHFRNASYSPAIISFDSDGLTLTVTYQNLPEDNYTLTLISGPGAFTDVAGNGLAGGNFSVDFALDVTSAPFSLPLAPMQPPGSLVYSGNTDGLINNPADSDRYTIDLAANQSATFVIRPTGTWQPTVMLLGPDGSTLGTSTASSLGAAAALESAPIAAGGTYTLVIGSAAGAGFFDAQLLLNAQIEIESVGGPSNNTAAGAENLDGAFVALDPFRSGQRAAVIGLGDGESAPPDFYSLTLAAGQRLTLGGATQQNGNVFMKLLDAQGHELADGSSALSSYTTSIVDFVAPAAGTYFVRVIGDFGQLYNIVAVKDAQVSTHTNLTAATAQPLGPNGLVLGNLSGGAKDSANYYTFAASAGDVLTLRTATPGGPPGEFEDGLDAQLFLFAPDGTPVAGDDNSAPDRRNAELHYNVTADGVYTIAVAIANGSGEYVLSVDGASAPAPADAPALITSVDSGVSSHDRITNVNNSSPARALQFLIFNTTAGATVQIIADGVVIGSTISVGSLASVVTDGTTVLSDGVHSIVARQILPGGTTLPDSSALALTIATASPPAPAAPRLNASTDSGTSSSDAITKIAAPLLDIPTPLYWQVFRNGIAVSPAFSTGPTFQSKALAPGTYHFTIRAMDTAGNLSPMGAALTVVIDQKPPTVAKIVAPPITTPGGTSYTFSITLTDASGVNDSSLGDSNIIVTGPLGYKQAASLMSVSGSGKSITATYQIASPPYGWAGVFSGTYSIVLQSKQVADIAGNVTSGGTIGTFKVSMPIGPPLAPVLAAISDRGNSQTDDLTNLNNANSSLVLVFIVTDTAPGSTVTIFADGIAIGSAKATGITTSVTTNGHFKLSNGKHRITARQTPIGGKQTADSAPLTITIDNQQLSAPAAPVLAPGQDSGISANDGITNVNNLTFNVTAGKIFRLMADGKVIGSPFTKGNVATTGILPDGTYNFVLLNVDDSGNESAASAATKITIDTKAPTVTTPGSLDTSFGKSGIAITASATANQIIATALQADGKIIAAGTSTNPSTGQTVLKIARYKADGTLDSTFGSHGVVFTGFGTTADTLTFIAIQSDGKILIGGYGPTQFVVQRLLSNGAIDHSFGGGTGQATITLAGPLALNAMLIQPSGAIVLGGQINGAFGLIRLTSTGSKDNAFGSGGSASAQFPGASPSSISSLALGAGGAIIAAGLAGSDGATTFALARFTSSGKLDSAFGAGGMVTTHILGASAARRVFVQSDGRITVIGSASGGDSDIAMARYLANGALDFSFGIGGIVDQPVGANVNVTDALLQSDGRIDVVANGGNQSFVYRFVSTGAPDPIFGNDGLLPFVMSSFGGSANRLLRQSSGNLIVGGFGFSSSAQLGGFALARVRGGGTYLALDPSSDSGISNADGITNVATPLLDMVGRGSNFYRIYINGNLASSSYATAATFKDLQGLGNLTFTLVDAAGNESPQMPMAPATLDTNAPVIAHVTALRQITAPFAGPYTASIFFADDSALDFSSLAAGVTLTGPNGFKVIGKLTGIQINGPGLGIATYQFALPGNGFDGSNNGTYSLMVDSTAARDVAGNPIDAQTALEILVDIASGG